MKPDFLLPQVRIRRLFDVNARTSQPLANAIIIAATIRNPGGN